MPLRKDGYPGGDRSVGRTLNPPIEERVTHVSLTLVLECKLEDLQIRKPAEGRI